MVADAPAQIIAGLSRLDRVANRGIRERDRRLRKVDRVRPGPREAEAYEGLIERLTRVHQVAFKRIDWDRIEADGPMVPAIARNASSAAARKALADYRPSMIDTLLGLEAEKRRDLTNRVVEASRADAELYNRARAEAAAHNRMLALAADVRALDIQAIAGVLKVNGAAEALKDIVEGFRLHADGKDRLIGQIDLWEYDAFPDEACTTSGFVPVSDMDRCQLQLANVCAVVLRGAVEILQVASVPAVEMLARRCRHGGQSESDLETVLYLKVPAAALAKLPLPKLDAAPTVTAFGAKIDWNALRGLAPIRIDDPAVARLTEPREAA